MLAAGTVDPETATPDADRTVTSFHPILPGKLWSQNCTDPAAGRWPPNVASNRSVGRPAWPGRYRSVAPAPDRVTASPSAVMVRPRNNVADSASAYARC